MRADAISSTSPRCARSSRRSRPSATRRAIESRPTIAHLDEYLIALKAKLEAQRMRGVLRRRRGPGARVHPRSSEKEQCERVVKGKSMTTEEIGLNDALMRTGIEVTETDLGEYIVQLRHEPPFAHHHARDSSVEGRYRPAVHRQIASPYTAEPEKLTAEARDRNCARFFSRRTWASPASTLRSRKPARWSSSRTKATGACRARCRKFSSA